MSCMTQDYMESLHHCISLMTSTWTLYHTLTWKLQTCHFLMANKRVINHNYIPAYILQYYYSPPPVAIPLSLVPLWYDNQLLHKLRPIDNHDQPSNHGNQLWQLIMLSTIKLIREMSINYSY